MACAKRSVSTLAIGTRSNSQLPKPAGLAAGDFIVIIISSGAAAAVTITAPTGFSTLTGTFLLQQSRPDPWTTRLYVFYKVANGSEGATFDTTHSSASTDGVCYAWTGVDTGTPFSPTQTTNSGTGNGGTTTITYTGLTPTLDGAGIIACAISWDGWTSSSAPGGANPTFTEDFDSGSSGASYSASGVQNTAGATGDKTNTTTLLLGNPWSSAMLALKPAGAGGGATATAWLLGA